MTNHNTTINRPNLGFYVAAFGTVLILLWVGLFKFTAIEAKAIEPLVSHHFMTSWMYKVFSVQAVSNLIGSFEIVVAILVVVGLKNKWIGKCAAIGLVIMFLMTLSYLFTTPGIIKLLDGMPTFSKFPHADFFILKDIMYLGFGLSLFHYSKK